MQSPNTLTKDDLIKKFFEIEKRGWIENTSRKTNDGAAGNLLEDLLGIPENNLPIPNAAEWELKTHKDGSSSMLTLFHLEPSPRACKLVSNVLLPRYGWKHKLAGTSYPKTELSFRLSLISGRYTRGFTITPNDKERKICITFDPNQVKDDDEGWVSSVMERKRKVYNNEEAIVPYWGYDDLFAHARKKLTNCFFVLAEATKEYGAQWFHYFKAYKLSDLNEDKFIQALKDGTIDIDFDARTGHNHGTKFRLQPQYIPLLYTNCEVVMDKPKLPGKSARL